MSPLALIPLAILVTLAWWPLRALSRRAMWIGTVAIWALLWALPWLADRSSLPALAAVTLVVAAALPAKLIDSAAAPWVWNERPLRVWAFFLSLPFVVCFRGHLRDPARPRDESVRLVLRGLVELAVGVALLGWAFSTDWRGTSVVVEHLVKLTGVYLVALDGGFVLATGALRLAGFTIHDLCDHPILALTPADFWRRYNRDAGRFYFENLFRRLPVRSAAVRTLVVFFANGLVHEYLAWVLCGRAFGYQVAFFSLQGIGVALTARLRPTGPLALISRAATVLFMLATSVLFLANVDQAFPWFQRR